jgi:hypothetical protein
MLSGAHRGVSTAKVQLHRRSVVTHHIDAGRRALTDQAAVKCMFGGSVWAKRCTARRVATYAGGCLHLVALSDRVITTVGTRSSRVMLRLPATRERQQAQVAASVEALGRRQDPAWCRASVCCVVFRWYSGAKIMWWVMLFLFDLTDSKTEYHAQRVRAAAASQSSTCMHALEALCAL